MFSFFSVVIFFSIYIYFLDKRNEFGVGLEILQTPSKLICFFYFFALEKRNEFGVTLEILQTLSKLTPNSLQTQRDFIFSILLFIFWKRGISLERVWRVSKLSPNPLQNHVFFGYLCHIMSQPKKLLVQEALQSSASSACSTVYELLETSPPRVTPEKQEFRL